jgi:LPS-assembly lipoprotein
MSSSNAPRLLRLLLALSLAGLTAGCFQPLYGDRSVVGGNAVADKMSSVEVIPIDVPKGTRLARIGVEVRDALIFNLTGGSGASAPDYKLKIDLSAGQYQVIVDINSGRPDIQNYLLVANYSLQDIATGKSVVTASTTAQVSYNIPGQQQRFAGDRGLRDAESRAGKEIAENIRTRLTSYFAAGT